MNDESSRFSAEVLAIFDALAEDYLAATTDLERAEAAFAMEMAGGWAEWAREQGIDPDEHR